MATQSKSSDFRVVIVGGGIAGLTLANALERAHIDYVLLEAREKIGPHAGASIAFFANGCRILDQLGCFDAVDAESEPLRWIAEHLPSGEYNRAPSDRAQLGRNRYDRWQPQHCWVIY